MFHGKDLVFLHLINRKKITSTSEFFLKKKTAENKFISVNYSFNAIWIAILNTQHVPVYWLPEGAVCLCMHMCICVCNIKSEYQKKTTLHRVSHGVEGIEGCPPILRFFSRNPHPPKLMPPPHRVLPPLKNEAPSSENNPPPPHYWNMKHPSMKWFLEKAK